MVSLNNDEFAILGKIGKLFARTEKELRQNVVKRQYAG